MLQWLKKRLAGSLGDKKDVIKNLPVIKQLNSKANKELDSSRNKLLQENYLTVLSDIYNDKNNDLKIWLDFGTLLGMYRENGFVKTDFDMDFGVYEEQLEEFKIFSKSLEEKGYRKTREFYYNNQAVEFSYSYKGLNIDFVVYRKNNEVITTETIAYKENLRGNITNIEAYNFNVYMPKIKSIDYNEIKIEVPYNDKEYLEQIYGADFMKPVLNYDWRANKIYKEVDKKRATVILL